VSGPKLKLSILTSAFAAEGWSFAPTVAAPANKSIAAMSKGITKLAVETFFLVMFCSLSGFNLRT
jgi:hypothetical protein